MFRPVERRFVCILSRSDLFGSDSVVDRGVPHRGHARQRLEARQEVWSRLDGRLHLVHSFSLSL